MTEKRFHKLRALHARRDLFERRGRRDASIGLIAWGSVAGVAHEAFERAEDEGLDVQLLVPRLLYPVVEEVYREFFARVRAGLVVEQSFQGQLYRILRMFVDVPPGVQSLARPGATPIAVAGDRGPPARRRAGPPAKPRRRAATRRVGGDHETSRARSSRSGARAAAISACCRRCTARSTAIGRPPHEIAFVSGIGCSSRIPGYTTAYGFNSIHGRALPIAQGIKIANPELLVLVAGGDGDGFSIGGGHVPHAVRRNVDLTYIVMDNQIYGLTKGQLSPTSRQGLRTVTSVTGSIEQPFNPLLAVLAYGAPLRRAGDAGGHGRADLHDRGGDPLPRLRVRERAVAVRDLRGPRLAAEGPQGGDGEGGRPRTRSDRPPPRDGRWPRVTDASW